VGFVGYKYIKLNGINYISPITNDVIVNDKDVNMGRPRSAIGVSDLQEAFDRINTGGTVSSEAKRLKVRPSTLRYNLKALNGGVAVRTHRRFAKRCSLPMDVAILAYIAGIIDGEGWICCSGRSRQIGVANTNIGVIAFLAKYGGLVSARTDKSLRCGTIKSVKRQYCWLITRAPDVLDFLVAVSPYMIIKKEKALDTIAYIRQWLAIGNNGKSWKS
jgi:hypothetical protein